MSTVLSRTRRALAALVVSATVASAQQATTPALQGLRVDGQASDWALIAVTPVVTAVAFRYAGWPMTAETDARRRQMRRWHKLAPVWMSALTATVVATATREVR